MSKDIVYVKSKMQYSKIVTTIILLMSGATWLLGFIKCILGELDFMYLADYTRDQAFNLIPYFCLAMSDRFKYAFDTWLEIKNRGGHTDGMANG